MLKLAQSVRMTGSKIKIEYNLRHCGAATLQQHSGVVSGCGVVIKQNCPMQWESWTDIPQRTKEVVIFDLKDISPEAMAYLEESLATRYKHWKNYLHTHFQRYDDPEVARLHGCPIELKDRPEDWEWLCKHFTNPKFVKKSIAGKKARDSKTLLHHYGSKPFSYRLEARCQGGSKFREIDTFEEVYVRLGNEISEHLHALMVEKRAAIVQKATSQFPPDTSIEDITVLEDAGFQIVTDVMEQNFGRRHGKVVRCMGKTRVRETGASSSNSNTAEVDALKEQGEQMKAQGEQMKEQMRDLVRAIQTSGLQISLPVPDLATPLTFEPLQPADT
ncbi:hypothetical protein TB1_037546 [Malus domestica]